MNDPALEGLEFDEAAMIAAADRCGRIPVSQDEGVARASVVRGGTVLPHVQAFAEAVMDATDVTSIGTYPGHSPDITRALDIFHPVNDPGLAQAVCDYALEHWDRYGLWYVISRQKIYNPSISRSWRQMEDRGSITQNHFDHVHVSFNAEAPAQPTPEEDEMKQEQIDTLNYIAKVVTEFKDLIGRFDPKGKGDYWRGQDELERLAKGKK